MKNKRLQALVEELLGSAAAEPVHGDEPAKEHTPEVENKDVLVGQHAEEVKEVIVENEDAVEPEEHKEIADSGEYDYEGDMAKSQLRVIADAAQELHDKLGDQDNLPEWVQSKITLAKEYIDTARDYMKSEHQEEPVQESFTREELSELFEALDLDTHKYTFEYLSEALGFVESKSPISGALKMMKAKGSKATKLIDKIYDKRQPGSRHPITALKAKWALKTAEEENEGSEKPSLGDALRAERKKEKESTNESYTREELLDLFEALNLDTHKYTFEFLAEELGFAAAEPVHTDAPAKEHTPEVENKDILDGQHAEEVKEVIVEGMRGRPSFKSLRVAPKGAVVVGKNGNIEKIKNLQKKE